MPYLIDPPNDVSPYSEPKDIQAWIDDLKLMDTKDDSVQDAIKTAQHWLDRVTSKQ